MPSDHNVFLCERKDETVLNIAEELLNQNRRALAKGISAIENDAAKRQELLKAITQHTGKAHVIGITGSPGAGKSSLANILTKEIRKLKMTVGILAIDPTSPFSGGALLGDRIRMQDHLADKGVFVRSMASRGSSGGLARTTKDAIKLLDAFGMDVILVETVGVGQLELDVMYAVDTTVLVLTPGAGDLIQTMKAGVMEIADIFVVNKSDLDGAHNVVRDVEGMLALGNESEWLPPIVMTTIKDEQTYADLYQAIVRHKDHLKRGGLLKKKRKDRVRKEIIDIVLDEMRVGVLSKLSGNKAYKELVQKVADCHLDIYSAADKILKIIM